MFQSILLDGLIVLIVLMLAAIGYHRGGMRELCTAVGILFGSRLADAWAGRWGSWLSDQVDISEGSARFIVWVTVVALATIICGYGTSLAFFSRPGPGGRLYGALLGMLNSVVLVSFVLDAMRRYLHDGALPEVVEKSHVARIIVEQLGWILLGIAAVIVLATAFGFLIRDHEPESTLAPYAPPQPAGAPASGQVGQTTSSARRPTAQPRVAPLQDTVPTNVTSTAAPRPEPAESTEPLRVREVRHWEDPVEPNPRTAFGSGWSQTWPVSSPGTEVKTPWEIEEERRRLRTSTPDGPRRSDPAGRTPRSSSSGSTSASDADALKEWLAEERRNEPDR